MKRLDRIGMWMSQFCLVHCVALPFLFVFFPVLTFLHSEVFEWSFVGASGLIALFAMLQGYFYHKRSIPTLLAIVGFGIFIISHLYGHEKVWMFVFAGAFIFGAHYVNHHFTHNCKLDHDHE